MSKFVDEGETNVGNIYLKNQTQNANLYLGLYKDTTEPAETATLAVITEVGATYGYARIALAPADWTESGQSIFTNSQKTFTASGGTWGNVYGYFLCTVASGTVGKLVCVEQFSDGPYSVVDLSVVKVTPKLTVA